MPLPAPTAEFLAQLHSPNPVQMFKNGFRSFHEIKGLFVQYLIGLSICFFISIILMGLLLFFIYSPVNELYFEKWSLFIQDWSSQKSAWLSWIQHLSTPILWFLKITFIGLLAYLSLRLATFFMIYWIDKLIEQLINHFRPHPDEGFSWKRFWATLKLSLSVTIKALLASVFFLFLSFIPFIGSILAYLGISRTAGVDILSPYLLIVGEYDNSVIKAFPFKTKSMIKAGWFQGLIIVLPFIGWVLMPIFLILQILGYAYHCELQWQESKLVAGD